MLILVVLREKVLDLKLEELKTLSIIFILDGVDESPNNILINFNILVLISYSFFQCGQLLFQTSDLKVFLSQFDIIIQGNIRFLAFFLVDNHSLLVDMCVLGDGLWRARLFMPTSTESHERR
jgi:hypothetical protein